MTSEYNWENEDAFGNYSDGSSGSVAWVWNDMGTNSTIYKMMSWAKQRYATQYGLTTDTTGIQPTYFTEERFEGLELDPVTAVNQFGGLIPMVCLYKINYEAYNNATAQP
jgi:hypothetical protein